MISPCWVLVRSLHCFFEAMIKCVAAKYPIDARRLYLGGVSSGGTIIACARALAAAGATTIDAVVTHALFPETLCGEMAASGIRSIRSTSSVPHSTNAILLDELFVDALKDELPETFR